MDFFSGVTTLQIVGLFFLLGGAAITFFSRLISKRMQHKNANLIVKFIGLFAAIVGFLLIMVL